MNTFQDGQIGMPTEEGWYWFVGYRWYAEGATRFEAVPVRIRKTNNSSGGISFVGVADNAFMFKQEKHYGLWFRLKEIEDQEEIKAYVDKFIVGEEA